MRLYIYWCGEGVVERKSRYMYLQDGVIRDPYNILGVDGRIYSDYKKEITDFLKKEGIRP